MKKPKSLFVKTGISLALTMLLFLLLSAFVVVHYILMPVSKRAANDFASLIVLSAQTWVELAPELRPVFEKELQQKHDLIIRPVAQSLPIEESVLPYIQFLQEALFRLTGQSIKVNTMTAQGRGCFCVDVPAGNYILRVSFNRDRIGARTPEASLIILAVATLLIFLTSFLLARHITVPVTRLSRAITHVGREEPIMLPEVGPKEVVVLTRHFNTMAKELADLLQSRMTLFAGISHDLRTPITRMQLAVEMLADNPKPELIQRLKDDLEEMNELITETLELARELKPHKAENILLRTLITELVESFQFKHVQIHFYPESMCVCTVDSHALRRILMNLIDNAIRYGEGKPIEVHCRKSATEITIEILDQGPGISESDRQAVFQPFHRIEQSRSRQTGGSGLGLAIVKQLCDTNGWRVEIVARKEGGAIARLSIPLHDDMRSAQVSKVLSRR